MATDTIKKLIADNVNYDNTASGLTASNVQDALDEVNSNKANVNHNHNGLYARIIGPKAIANNATETISLENGTRWLLVTTVFGNCGLYCICRAANGTPAVQNLIAHSYATVSTSNQNITVKASGGQGIDIMLIRVL